MFKNVRTKIALLTLVTIGAGVFVGCQESEHDRTARGRGDAPVGRIDGSAAHITEMPDNYRNIAFKCIGHSGVYETTQDLRPEIVPNDANCAEGAAPLPGRTVAK